MTDEPVSQMIRIPTPLVDAIRKLARLHRAGRTKAVLEGIERLVVAIDSETDIDIASVSETISRLSERLDRLEAPQLDSSADIDIASVTHSISERLEKVENDINSLALTIADLNVRVSDLEGVGDIGYAVSSIAELEASEAPLDIRLDIEATAETANQDDITTDVEQIAELQPPPPLTQSALARRLGCSDKVIEKHRKQGSKENFAVWSRDLDPEGWAWIWEGQGGRGRPLRFVPANAKAE
jgi:hypothetical protein